MNRMTVDEYQHSEKIPLLVILDNVRSQHNIGAVFRTADAFRLSGLYLCGCCATPPNQEIHKTALGAEVTVDWEFFDDTRMAVSKAKEYGYKIFAIEQAHDSIMLQDFRCSPADKIAIILGHEVFGVQQEVIDMADGCIEIPQYGTKHSLNVSVAAGIVMYNISNQLNDTLK